MTIKTVITARILRPGITPQNIISKITLAVAQRFLHRDYLQTTQSSFHWLVFLPGYSLCSLWQWQWHCIELESWLWSSCLWCLPVKLCYQHRRVWLPSLGLSCRSQSYLVPSFSVRGIERFLRHKFPLESSKLNLSDDSLIALSSGIDMYLP